MASSPYYILGSGPLSDEVARLDTQYAFFRKLTRGILPKDIWDTLSKLTSPRIADVGTGTAIWLVDLASRLPPTSELQGFDIDTAKFPSAEKLPPNVKLQQLDARKPFPSEHLGSYDVVHAGFFMYALSKDEWEPMTRNLITLLKPGGWLLWEDTGYSSWVTLPPSPAINAILDYDIRFAQKVGRDITHPAKLLSYVENSGLVDSAEKNHTDFDLTASKEGQDAFVKVLAGALKGIVARGGMAGLTTAEDVERLIKAAVEELSSGKTIFGAQFKWVWGRKAE